jgi:hypothetical protein
MRMPDRMFDPEEMAARVQRLIEEGKMPTLEEFTQVLDLIRPEYQREIEAIRQTGSPPSPRPGRKQN